MNTATDAPINLENMTGNVITFGVSSTVIPSTWTDITPTTGPSGVPQIDYFKRFIGNTIIYDAGAAITTRIPGITAANTVINGQADSWMNFRFFT